VVIETVDVYPRRVDVGKRMIEKIIAESLSNCDEKNVVQTPLSKIRVGRSRDQELNVPFEARRSSR
jgi:hypothetical protein